MLQKRRVRDAGLLHRARRRRIHQAEVELYNFPGIYFEYGDLRHQRGDSFFSATQNGGLSSDDSRRRGRRFYKVFSVDVRRQF